MHHSKLRYWIGLSVFMAIMTLTGCAGRVAVPTPGQDKPPLIHIANFAVGGGAVDRTPVSTTSTVHVTPGTRLLIFSNANNAAGGVQSFSIRIRQGATVLYDLTATGTVDVSHTAPIQLNIDGTDGAGRPGSAAPIGFTATNAQPVVLSARATSFNRLATSITVTYLPGSVQAPPATPVRLSGVQIVGGGQALVTQGTSGSTFVAGKHILVRMFGPGDLPSRVSTVFTTVSSPGGAIANFTTARPNVVVETAAPNGPSAGVVLPGATLPHAGTYTVTTSARDSWGEELAHAAFAVTLEPTKDLRVLVVMGYHEGVFTPTPDWYLDIDRSMTRLGSMLPVRDGVHKGLDNQSTSGLRYTVGKPCDGWTEGYYPCVYEQTRAINAAPGDHVDITVEYRPGLYQGNPPGDPYPGGNSSRPPRPYSDLWRAACVAGRWQGIEMTAPVVAQELGHNFGLEPAGSPNFQDPQDPGHSSHPYLNDPYAYDFVRSTAYIGRIGDVMNNRGGGISQGADHIAFSPYDWEYLRGGQNGLGGLMALSSTGTG